MKNYDDKLFVGNIMQRTLFEDGIVGPNIIRSHVEYWTKKENALLYRTKNGGYVDVDELDLEGLFAPLKVRMVEITVEKHEQYVRSNLTVLPAITLTDVSKPTKEDGPDGVLGRFVDSDSIIPYQEFRKVSSKIKSKSR